MMLRNAQVRWRRLGLGGASLLSLSGGRGGSSTAAGVGRGRPAGRVSRLVERTRYEPAEARRPPLAEAGWPVLELLAVAGGEGGSSSPLPRSLPSS